MSTSVFFYHFRPQYTRLCVLFFILLSLGLTASAQVTRYVSTTGTNSNPISATSWATSTTDLQGVINASEVNDQVWVATGTYKPGGNQNTNRSISFVLKNEVAIYGGFRGTEANLAQRLPITLSMPSSSTLSGDINTPGNATDNSYHVINNPNTLTNSAILDGFVVTSGNSNASNPEYSNQEGGGMRNNGYLGQCSPTIRYCLFTANEAKNGAAIYNGGQFGPTGSGSNPVLINCWFVGNSASQYGGGIYNYGTSGNCSPRLINCLFRNNSAQYGGGLYNLGYGGSSGGICNPEFINCTFSGNGGTGQAMYNDGRNGGTCAPRITNCIVWPNTISSDNANPVINYSDVAGGIPAGTGNKSADPLFTDAASGNLQLRPLSPAINAGNSLSYAAVNGPATDLDGNARIVGQQIDMGILEYNTPCSVSLTSSNQQVRCTGSTATLTATPLGGMRPFSYSWAASAGVIFGTPTSTSTLAITLTTTGLQSVTVTMTDALSCVSQAILSFTISDNTPLYVKAGGTGNGSSWTNASGDLQAMINLACPNGQVWVASGTYKPTTGNTRTISFAMRNQLTIYGGFDGDEETLQERPPVTIITPSSSTLSGDIGTVNTTSDNSYHVINNTGLNSSAVLDGFVIVSGNANGSSSDQRAGGGMYNNGASGQCNPLIRNCIFRNNLAMYYGGGMYNYGISGNSSPTIIGCAFLANYVTTSSISSYGGGGLYNDGYAGISRLVITNCLFSQNTAINGGAIYNDGTASGLSAMTLVNTTIYGNRAGNGGAISSGGNGPHLLINTIIWGNTASSSSPGLRTSSGANHTVFFSDVQNFTPANGSGNLSIDPVFSNTATGNFTLQATSPVIDKGSSASYTAVNGPPIDGAGNQRIINQQIDMGAFESSVTSPTVVASTSVSALCPGGIASLSAIVVGGVSPFSYTWTAPVGTTLSPSSTSTVSATLATSGVKTFTVTALDTRSQRTTATVSITENSLPVISSFVASGTLTCANPSATLTVTMGEGGLFSYNFDNRATPIGSTNQAIVTAAGTYSLLVTNTTTGCSSTTNVVVERDITVVPVSLSASGSTLTCAIESVTLTATADGNPGYSFSGGSPASNPNQVIVSSPGGYSVIVTGQNGCTNVASTTITQNTSAPDTPVLSISNNGLLTCSTTSLTLLATVSNPTNLTFSFAGPGLTTQTGSASSVVVNQPGTFTVTVINAQGCTSFTMLAVADNSIPPVVSLTASHESQITCTNPILTLTASSTLAATFTFSGPGLIGQSTTGVASVSALGLYSVTALSANGCTASTTIAITGASDYVGPVSVATTGVLGCLSTSVTLVATSTGATSFSLSGPAGNQIQSSGIFIVSEVGNYTIVAGNGLSGCLNSTIKPIRQSPPASASNFIASGSVSCGNPTRLTATGTGSSFVFTGPEGYAYTNAYRSIGTYPIFANDVKTPGRYTLTVYTGEGCPPAVYTVDVSGNRCQ